MHPSNPRSGAVELQENLSNRLTFLLGREGRARGILDGEDGEPRALPEIARGAVPGDASLSPYPTLSRRLPVPYTNSLDARLRPNRSVYRARPLRRACAPESRTHAASDVRRIPSRSLPQLAVVLALLIALGGACWYAVSTLTGLVDGARASGSLSTGPQSTPKSAWKAGEVPALYQRDPAWADGTYAEDDFGTTGCGPTCMAMAYVALTGRTDMTPADMGAFSERLGCATPDGTAWTFMTEGAAELGLVAEEVPADEQSVRRALLSGSPVICSVGPGDFTSTGHFIVLAGIDEQGRLLVRDPNSPERTGKAWDFATVLGQCRAIWAYTAA